MVPQGHKKKNKQKQQQQQKTKPSFVMVISQTRTQRYLCVLGVRENWGLG